MTDEQTIRTKLAARGYEVLQLIARGKMGSIYKARQTRMDRLVALKVLPPDLARDRTFVERFIRAARAAGRLNHPNIVAALDAGEADGLYYFVMEFVAGQTLAALLRQQAALPERRALDITAALARALLHAHQQGIVHADLQPSDVLLAPNGAPKLLDLGTSSVHAGSLLTDEEALMTPYYRSPEQVQGQPADARSDLYALGAILYHMLTGSVPYEGPTPEAVLNRHLADPVPDPRRKNPSVSAPAATVVLRLMAKRPQDRYPSAAALLADLDRVRSGQAPSATPSAEQPQAMLFEEAATAQALAESRFRRTGRARRKSYSGLILVLVLLFASLGGAAWLLYHKHISGGLPGLGSAQSRAEALHEAARRAFEEAKSYAEERPDDYEGAVRCFDYVIRTFPDTLYSEQAQVELAGVEERRRAAASKLLQELLQKASSYMADDDFRHALGAFSNIPPQLYLPDVREAVEQFKQTIRQRAEQALRKTDQQAIDLWAAGKPEEAIRTLEYGSKYQLFDQRDLLQQRIAQIRKAMENNLPPTPVPFRTQYTGPRERRHCPPFALPGALRPRLLYATVIEEFYKLLAERQYEKALEELDVRSADESLTAASADLEQDRQVAPAVRQTWAAIPAALERLKGHDATLAGLRGTIEDVEQDDTIVLQSYGAALRIPVSRIRSREAAEILERDATQPGGQSHPFLPVFIAIEEGPEAAAQQLDRVKLDRPTAQQVQRLVNHVQRSRREIDTVNTLLALEQQVGQYDWIAAAQSLDTLERLREHPTAVEALEALAPWTLWVREAAFLSRFFRGNTVLAEPGPAAVSWDFSRREQLRDWDQAAGAWQVAYGAVIQNEEFSAGWLRSRARWLDAAVRLDAVVLDMQGAVGLSASDLGGSQVALVIENDAFSVRRDRIGGDIFGETSTRLAAARLSNYRPGDPVRLQGFFRDGHVLFAVNGQTVAELPLPDFQLETFEILSRGRCAVDNVSVEGSLLTAWVQTSMARAASQD